MIRGTAAVRAGNTDMNEDLGAKFRTQQLADLRRRIENDIRNKQFISDSDIKELMHYGGTKKEEEKIRNHNKKSLLIPRIIKEKNE